MDFFIIDLHRKLVFKIVKNVSDKKAEGKVVMGLAQSRGMGVLAGRLLQGDLDAITGWLKHFNQSHS